MNRIPPAPRDRRAAALAPALTLALASLLSAQVPVTAPDSGRLTDLVVTATGLPVRRTSIPFATTVIRGDDLRARGIRYVLDALRDVPGLAVVQTGGYGSVASVFLRGGESDDVRVLLDGVPLNLPGGAFNFANLTTADIDRIEVVRGPASVLYGADAMSGVIQIFTRRAAPAAHLEAAMQGGSFGAGNADLTAGYGGDRWVVDATASRTANEGTYAFNDRYRNTGGTVQGSIASGASRLGLVLRYGDAGANFPTDGAGNPVDRNQFTTEHSLQAEVGGDHPLSNRLALHLSAYGSRLDQGYTNRADSPADTSGFDFVDDRTGVTWRRGGEARVDWRAARATTTLGVGLEAESDRERDAGESNFGSGASIDTTRFAAHRTTRDAYLQLLAAPVPRLSIQAGTRLDINSAFGTFATWRIGASLAVGAAFRVWGAAGSAFKAPTFPEQFASSALEVGDPDLRPERSVNDELGAGAELLDHRVEVTAAAFWQRFRDLIQYLSAAPGAPTYANLGGADARGVELAIAAMPVRRLRLAMHWTWLHTEVTDTGASSSLNFEEGQSLLRRPGASGGASVAYAWSLVTATVSATFVGARDDIDFSGPEGRRVILPSYSTWDLSLDAPLRRHVGRSPGVELTLRGENLLDAAYQQTVGFPGRIRTLLAGARLSF